MDSKTDRVFWTSIVIAILTLIVLGYALFFAGAYNERLKFLEEIVIYEKLYPYIKQVKQ